MLQALGVGPFAPSSEAAWFEGFSHAVDDLAFAQPSYLENFFKGYAIGPGGPDNPIRVVLGRLGFFDPCNGELGLLRIHWAWSYNLAANKRRANRGAYSTSAQALAE